MNFFDVLWLIIISFAFVAYLSVLLSIVRDLFRDHGHNGWWKAIWVVFLVFVPFLTALVYLIVNGRGMSERQLADAQQHQHAAQEYVRDLAGRSPASEIADAAALRDAGTITDVEFQALKAKALA